MAKQKLLSFKSIFSRSQLGFLLISFAVFGVALASISFLTFNAYATQNLKLVGETLSDRVQPALVFQDQEYLQQSINTYVDNYPIRYIEIHTDTEVIESKREIQSYSIVQDFLEAMIYSDALQVDVNYENKKIASLWLYPSAEQISGYLFKLLLGLFVSLSLLVVIWWYSIQRIYHTMMGALQPLIHLASVVSEQKAYNLRFDKSRIFEFNILIQAFNQLLAEIQAWQNSMQKEHQKLSFQAHHDELTALPNRHVFYQALNDLFADPVQREQSALVLLDNNNFKSINDTYGHQVGDAILREMANRLKSRIRHQDLMVRIGGDEFAIILKSIQKAEYLGGIAENLMACCKEPLVFDGKTIAFDFSIGIAFSANAATTQELIRQADQAMYQAKAIDSHWVIFHAGEEN
ncbi:MAG: diguanylate cyclase [Acinetobacter sp.]|nr:diguanylate cyclase [Acinetobacter sp.]